MFSNSETTDADITMYGECYFISTESDKGLQWNKLPRTVLRQILHKVSGEKLTLNSVKKVCDKYAIISNACMLSLYLYADFRGPIYNL